MLFFPYKAFSYYYEVMKLFNITDVYDDHTGWSMMEQSVMSFCNLSWHQVIHWVNVLETLHVKCTMLTLVVVASCTQVNLQLLGVHH